MSLNLLVDEDSQAKYLVNLLKSAGHDVLTVNEAKLSGASDLTVFNYAREQGRVLMTHNCDDFQDIHQSNRAHPGILAIYQNMDPKKNMSYQAIVSAIQNLEAASLELEGQFIVLNQWDY